MDRLMRNLAGLPLDLAKAAEAGLFEAGSIIQGDAMEKTPVDTGNLRASAFTITASLTNTGNTAAPTVEARQLAKTTPTEVTAVVGFGGPSAPYALVQHERTDLKHTVGEAKFLHKAVQQNASKVPVIVGKHLARVKPRGPA